MSDRLILTPDPLNAELRIDSQEGLITPASRHYVRTHFPIPDARGTIAIAGAVTRPRTYTLDDIRSLPSRSSAVTLECAGNGRAFLEPPAPGEPWGLGAVSTAEWTGVPLRALLEPAGLHPGAVEILFRGADAGVPQELGRSIAFERSLAVDRAMSDEPLVAYAMNGAPIPRDLGAPLRLVVPRHYGMASVKWLVGIVAIDAPFDGFFQVDRYVIDGAPIGPVRPRAIVVDPGPSGARVGSRIVLRGYAWSGHGAILRVEASTDGGSSWRDAALGGQRQSPAWREWSIEWTPERAGTYSVIARATDASGAIQPLAQQWNELGYANNAAQPVRVSAR